MYIEILILSELQSAPKYGYEIKKNIQNLFGEHFEINHNLLYPKLHWLEKIGALSKQIQIQEGKPNRHIYSLSTSGEAIFQDLMRDFPEKYTKSQTEFYVRVAFFSKLDNDSREIILSAREKYLNQQLECMQGAEKDNRADLFILEVLNFGEKQIQEELVWISKLRHSYTTPKGLAE